MNEVIIAAIAAGVGAVLTAVGKLIVDTIKAKKEKTGDLELQYSHEENLIKLTSTLRNDLVSQLEEIKDEVSSLNDKIDEFSREQRSYNISMLRHDITCVYENYKKEKRIPTQIYQSMIELYDKYKKIGGNSYVKEIVAEMKEWDKE